MIARLIMAIIAGLLLIVLGMIWLAEHPAPAPPPAGLHTVWCVKRGYPADLALPYVTGPGTGLSGCPPGTRQVSR